MTPPPTLLDRRRTTGRKHHEIAAYNGTEPCSPASAAADRAAAHNVAGRGAEAGQLLDQIAQPLMSVARMPASVE
jgi:hypothetical protein